ncbi:MAG: DMT family transporter [Clostridia bacterium]|nr:DMT family transporter [Clostridia bacterium]
MDNQQFYTNRKVRIALASFCALLWGSAYPAIKSGYELFAIATNDLTSKFIFAGLRFFLAGLMVLIVSVAMKKDLRAFEKRNIGQVVLYSLTYTTVQYAIFYIGLSYTTGTNGSIMNSTLTFFSFLIAHFLYHNERLTANRIAGVVAGFSGVIAALVHFGTYTFTFSLKGDGALILSAFMLAAASIYGKHITERLDAMVTTGYQLALGGALLALAGFLAGGRLTVISWQGITLLTYMAALSAIAFTLWTTLLKYNPVGKVTVFNFLVPIFGTLLSGIFLQENIWRLNYLLALALVSLGIWLVNREVKGKKFLQ